MTATSLAPLILSISSGGERHVDDCSIQAFHGQDQTGYFSLLAGHSDFVTVLVPSLIRWSMMDGSEHLAAIGQGELILLRRQLAIYADEVYLGTDPTQLLDHVRSVRAQRQSDIAQARAKADALDSAARRRLIELSERARA